MSVKIIFKNGTTQPQGSSWAASDGEPLWDRTHKKFYITNGSNDPTLIGPIDTSSFTTVNQMQSYVSGHDRNDNIKDFELSTEVVNGDTIGDVPIYHFGNPNHDYTQYLVNLSVDEETRYRFIDLAVLFKAVDDDKKVTMFFYNLIDSDIDWRHTKFPLFWSTQDRIIEKVGETFNMSIWKNSTKLFDTGEYIAAAGLAPMVPSSMYSTSNGDPIDRLSDAFSNILNNAIEGQTDKMAKVEIFKKVIEGIPNYYIYISCPGSLSVVSPINFGQNSTQIATIDGTAIYAPYCQGYVSITGNQGVHVTPAGQGQQTVSAALYNYAPLSGTPDSVVTGTDRINLSYVSLSPLVNGENKLCVKETSAFGDGASASYSAQDSSIEWTVSGESRSYATVLVDDIPSLSTIELSVNPSNACQSDHYLYIFNNTNTTIIIGAATPGASWSAYPVRGIPSPTALKPNTGVEVSLALRRYNNSDLNTAVMTASEQLSGTHVNI